MSNRLDKDRENDLQPKRMAFAINALEKLGYEVNTVSGSELRFNHEGATIRFYPYSGWFTGKTVNDGRGIEKLLNQLKKA